MIEEPASTSTSGEVAGFARFATVRDPDGNPVQLIEYER